MVLLFLGNWRSTLIIALTIPLSILASILVLLRARRDAQHHDARRARALGRHPGRPGDRDDREHRAPPAPRQPSSTRRSSSARARSACRRSSRRCASASCSCRCSSSPASPSFLFVPMAEAVVFAMIASYILSRTLVPTLVMLLMRGAHGDGSPTTRRGRARCSASTAPSTASSSACAAPTRSTLVGAAREARRLRRSASSASAVLSCLPLPVARPRLLPERRRRPDPPALPRADRHADRGDGAPRRRRRGGDPRADPEGPARDDPRQPRRAEQRHQPLVQQRRHDRHARRRDPAVAEGRATGRPRSS